MSVNLKIQFRTQLFQQCHIAASFASENKVRANADAVDFSEVTRQLADEFFAGPFTESFVKMDFQ